MYTTDSGFIEVYFIILPNSITDNLFTSDSFSCWNRTFQPNETVWELKNANSLWAVESIFWSTAKSQLLTPQGPFVPLVLDVDKGGKGCSVAYPTLHRNGLGISLKKSYQVTAHQINEHTCSTQK